MTDKPSKYRSILDNGNKKKDNHKKCQCKECQLKEKYSKHIDAYGGLFTPEMRMKLFKINPKNNIQYEDNSRDWSNIGKTVKNGLIDIQLLCEIASFSQIKKMFEHTLDYPDQGKGGEVSTKDSYALSTNLISALRSILSVDVSNDPKQRAVKVELEKKRSEYEKKDVLPLVDERREFVMEKKKLEKQLKNYKDDKITTRIIVIEDKIKKISAKIEIKRKPIELLDLKILHNDPKLELWKAKLAKEIINDCLYFLIESHFVYSADRKDYLDKVNLIIDSELSRYT